MRAPGYKTGFTIIEVMVFLAVSGFIFLIAAAFINGKQAQAEYTQGMNNANAMIKTLINNVGNGNYSFPGGQVPTQCSINASGIPIPTLNNGSPNPIGLAGCTIVGLVLAPDTNGSPDEYTIYTVAGCQFVLNNVCNSTSGEPPTSFSAEEPTVISQMTQSSPWPGGIVSGYNGDITIYVVGQGNTTGAIGIFASLPTQDGNVLQNGAQQAQLVYFPNTSVSNFSGTSISASSIQEVPAGDYVVMCFTGPNGKPGSIVIGGTNGGGQLTTTLGLGQEVSPKC